MILRRFGLAVIALSLTVFAGAVTGWYWLLHTESGAQFVWRQAEGALDSQMSAESLSGSISGGLVFENFRFTNDAVAVDIGRIVAAAEVSLTPLGVRVVKPEVMRVRVDVRTSEDDETGRPATEIVESLRLPLELEVAGLSIVDLVISGVSDEDTVINLASADFQWHETIDIHELSADSPLGRLNGSGDLSLEAPYAFTAAAQVESVVAPVGEAYASLSATGRVGEAIDGKADVRAENNSVDASVRFNWGRAGSTSGSVDIARLEVHRFVEQWPSISVVSGDASIRVAESGFDVESLELRASNSEFTVTASGGVDIDSARVNGDLVWRGFQWPLFSNEPGFRSDKGDIAVRGSLDAWEIDGSVRVAAIGVEDGEFTIAGRGDRTQASAEILESRVLGGTASGRVAYSWVGSQPWSAVIDVDNIQTGLIENQLAGTLSGHVDANGSAMPFELDATLESIAGRVRGRDLAANGRIQIADALISADDLLITHGDATFLLDGSLLDESGLRFDIEIDDLGEYAADALGTLSATGVVSTSETRPYIDIDASSRLISFRDSEVQDLRIENVDSGNALDIVVTSSVIAISGTRLTDTRATVTMNRDEQLLDVTTTFNNATVDLGIAGAFEDWQAPDVWRGSVEKLVLAVSDLPAAELLGAAPLQVSRGDATLESLCVGTERDATLCVNAAWESDELIDIEAQLNGLSVDVVNLFWQTGFRFEQELSGEIDWRQERGQPATGFAHVRSTSGRITNDERPDIVVMTEPGRIEFDVEDGRLLSGTLLLPMPGTGHINGDFSLVDVERGLDSAVEGSLAIDMNNIALLAAISPLVDEASGMLDADFQIEGPALEPVVIGQMRLENGFVSYLPLGLRLDDLNLDGELKPGKKVEMSGSFRSGDGRGEVFTSADYEYGMTDGIQIEIRGTGLQVIDLPDISAVADVDLDLGYDVDQLNLAGRIKIPQARIVPTNLGTGRVTESSDVVIVAGELPDDDGDERRSDLRIYGDLALELGDNVVIELAVARATATGQADFSWDGDPMPVANGRYTMNGDIQAFGQVLRITEGNVRFPNVPANDPLIRLFAEREIYGNPQIKTAGVLVAGSLRRPTIEAFTNPLTNEERALALLVTGSDFDYEQGVGAVDFGTYIAPRLFVSYGIGIFDRDNVISARYDLTEGFGIKATSGQWESGVDLTYRIER